MRKVVGVAALVILGFSQASGAVAGSQAINRRLATGRNVAIGFDRLSVYDAKSRLLTPIWREEMVDGLTERRLPLFDRLRSDVESGSSRR